MTRVSTIPQRVVHEEILAIDHHVGQFVRVLVGSGSVNPDGLFEFDVPQQFSAVEILDAPAVCGARGVVVKAAITDYSDLVVANPEWAPKKPAGTFRKDDLWMFIDRVRTRGIAP